MIIHKITVKNFKGIEEMNISNLKKINQVIGENGSGKTSLNKAIQFLFNGSGKDKKHIKEGESQASVSAVMEIKNQDVELERIVNKHGESKVNFMVNGTTNRDATSSLIREWFGLASFNPEDIVQPKERVKIFSSMITEKFSYPAECLKYFEKYGDDFLPNPESLEEENPINALKKLESGLEILRRDIGRDKLNAKSIYEEEEDNFKTLSLALHGSDFDIDNLGTTEDLLSKKAVYDFKLKELENKKENLENLRKSKEYVAKEISDLNISIGKAQTSLGSKEATLSSISLKIDKSAGDIKDVEATPLVLINKIEVARKRDQAVTINAKRQKKEKLFKEKEEEYKEINSYISNMFQSCYSKYIKPLEEKVKGLSFNDGKWFFKKSLIDNLSRSETLDLALKLIEAQGRKSNIVCIDNAEMFDEKTIKELSINTEGTAFMLMKVGEAFESLEGSVININKKDNKKTETLLI